MKEKNGKFCFCFGIEKFDANFIRVVKFSLKIKANIESCTQTNFYPLLDFFCGHKKK